MPEVATRFTLRQLTCFVTACDAGGVSLAATRLHLAQATVSAAIADLEQALGVQLLVRRPKRPAVPSPAGRELLREAQAVLTAAGRLEARCAALSGEVAGELPVGCLVTQAGVVGPRITRAFESRWPDVRVRLLPADQATLLADLHEARIDLAITYDIGLTDGIEFVPLLDAPPYALVASDHGLADRTATTLQELAVRPLVLLDLPLSRDYFLGLFRAAGLEPLIARRTSDPELVRSLVAHGYGYTLWNARPAPGNAIDGTPLVEVAVRSRARAPRLGIARVAGVAPTRTAAAFAETCAEILVSGK